MIPIQSFLRDNDISAANLLRGFLALFGEHSFEYDLFTSFVVGEEFVVDSLD